MEPQILSDPSDPQTWPDRHGDSLFRYALLRVRDRGLAEELVQETFLAALQARGRFAGRSSERSWLVGIMKHKIVDQSRRSCREQPADDPDAITNDLPDDLLFDGAGHWKMDRYTPRDWPDDPGRALEQKQFWARLAHCLGELPPKMARAFSLREVDELSAEEVCAILQISQSNFWVLMHRARKQLRRCLETEYFSGAPG